MSERPPHHAPRGGFRNPWSGDPVRGFRDVLRWRFERRRELLAADPPPGAFATDRPSFVEPRAQPGSATATWIGHATVLLQSGGLNILTDPMFSARAFPVQWMGPRRVMDPGLSLDRLPPIDLVLVSHNHYDHLDRGSVRFLVGRNPGAAWVVPLRLGPTLRGWGARDVVELDWWQSRVVGDVQITATPARHFSARGPTDRNRTLWCGYTITAPDWRGYFAGDTAYHPEFAAIGSRLGPFDLVMMPIGAYDPRWFMRAVHVDVEEAVQGFIDVAGGASLPMMLALHWGTFRLTDEPMDEPPRRVLAEWRRRGLDASRLWVAAFGETRGWGMGRLPTEAQGLRWSSRP